MEALKFGKYKGMTIESISQDPEGVEYLEWMRDNTDVNHKQYGAKNKELRDEIIRVLKGREITMPVVNNGNGKSELLLSSILQVLVRIEKILMAKESEKTIQL